MAHHSSVKLPGFVFAEVSPLSREAGICFRDNAAIDTGERLDAYCATEDSVAKACAYLQDKKFQIRQISDTTISIAGRPKLFDDTFGAGLLAERRRIPPDAVGVDDDVTFIAVGSPGVGHLPLDRGFHASGIESLAVDQPAFLTQTHARPPQIDDDSSSVYRAADFRRLRLPDDVAAGVQADAPHRDGITGAGTRVVLIDSGFVYHPYFAAHEYPWPVTVFLTTANTLTSTDQTGHGTAMAANILAVAPDTSLMVVGMTETRDGNVLSAVEAFKFALSQVPRPHVICCPWGFERQDGKRRNEDDAMESQIQRAKQLGVMVVFSAGNVLELWPNQHPDVLSVGGAYRDRMWRLTASDRSKSFTSRIHPGRKVPDLCGLSGPMPLSRYIVNPVPPGSVIDRLAGDPGKQCDDNWPDGACPDGTAVNDGWAVFSGTSAAAAHVAGVAALVKSANRALGRADVFDILKSTATPVAAGIPSSGSHGQLLVDAEAAVKAAKARAPATAA